MNAAGYRSRLEADIAEKRAAVEASQNRFTKAVKKLQIFDEVVQGKTWKPELLSGLKRKPGRPRKDAAAAQAIPVKRKPGRPRKVVAVAEAPKKLGRPLKNAAAPAKKKLGRPTKGKIRAAGGRAAVARGDRPPIKEAIKTVMGNKVMHAKEILPLIKAKNWTPNANDPRGYIAWVLSASKETFERVPSEGRGYYRVKGVAVTQKSNGKAVKPIKTPKVKAVKAKAVKAKAAKAPKIKAAKVKAAKVKAPKAEAAVKPEAAPSPKPEAKPEAKSEVKPEAPKVPAQPKKIVHVDAILAEAISPTGSFGE